MKAVILAGGRGTRLGNLTYNVQKTMLPINGKPVLEHQIDFLKKMGIKNILLSVGYLSEQIVNFFGNGYRLRVNIDYIVENEPIGTAGPLRLAKNKLRETFIVVNGDTLTDANIANMIKFHEKENVMATIMLVESEETKSRGAVKMNGNRIIEFVEKPATDVKSLINGGWYVIEPEVIDLIPEGYCMLEKNIFPILAERRQLCGWRSNAKILDMGTPERLEKVKQWEF